MGYVETKIDTYLSSHLLQVVLGGNTFVESWGGCNDDQVTQTITIPVQEFRDANRKDGQR